MAWYRFEKTEYFACLYVFMMCTVAQISVNLVHILVLSQKYNNSFGLWSNCYNLLLEISEMINEFLSTFVFIILFARIDILISCIYSKHNILRREQILGPLSCFVMWYVVSNIPPQLWKNKTRHADPKDLGQTRR